MTNEAIITTKIDNTSTATLVEMAKMLGNKFEDGADFVLSSILSTLEARMDEASFISLCEELGA